MANNMHGPAEVTMGNTRGSEINGYNVSPAALLDPKSSKRHLSNGEAQQDSHSASPPSSPCPPSESAFSSLTSPPTSPVHSSEQFTEHHTHLYHDDEGRTKNTSLKMSPMPKSTPQYSPSQLLNPRSLHKKEKMEDPIDTAFPPKSTEVATTSSVPQFVFGSTTPKPSEQSVGPDKDSGMANLIERVHNVSKREDRPTKKQKIEHEDEGDHDEQSKSNFSGGGRGSEIAEYMRQKRKQGLEESGPTSTVVDLTADDDDDVMILDDHENQEVCYGRIEGTKVQAHAVPYPNPKTPMLSQTGWPSIRLTLSRYPGKNSIIVVRDATEKDFGNVDPRTSIGLAPLMDSAVTRVRTQARLNPRKKKPFELPGSRCSEYFDMTINLYGPRKHAHGVGKFLSQKQLWLRIPYMVDQGIEVCNPHAMRNSNLSRTNLSGRPTGTGTISYVTRTAEEVRSDVIGMFDSLQQSENLPELEPDPRVITPLLSHQKQGLHFMTNKEKARVFSEDENENSSLWRLVHRANGQKVYYNVITGLEERDRPPEVLGGILADMMGLGKTLSILALAVGSLEDAERWANEMPDSSSQNTEFPLLRNSKATLLIAPLSVVANWEEQILAHIKPGTLDAYIYHGPNRSQDINELAKHDIVVTTYSTVSSEFSRRSRKREGSPLLQTNFFRIVLDEAHMIREQSTRQYQAISILSAQRRWAVTGTPVQNRLDDLGALIKFLRIKPFDENGGFNQFILSPFKNADPEILPKLRVLVDSITLRRLKDRIDLPPRHDSIVKLQFSKDERELYEWFAKDAHNKQQVITSGNKKTLGGKGFVHVLQAILRLRLICAHGKELLGEEDLKLTEGFSSSNAIDLEEDQGEDRPIMTSRQAYEMLMLFRETDTDTCSQCMRRIAPKEMNIDEAKDEVIGYLLPCYQIICKDCSTTVKQSIYAKAQNNHFTCPFCDQYLRLGFFELTQEGIEAAEEAKANAKDDPKHAKIMGRYGGPHTKTTALIQHLIESRTESMEKPDEPPIKSVVFSGWTTHLDLIQIALEDNMIKYVRLDGKMTRVKRSAALDAFRDDPEYTVILVSITAGGLGLNLTAGSRVYVMEPQFNPAQEAQAVDRVHRLGQKREVFITRFIMDNSFEEKMLLLQQKKQKLSDLSLDRGKLDKIEVAKRRMEELRSLFK